MTFAQTYREERMVSRCSRARKARIAGRIIGFGLTACLVVALRTEPQLRTMVEDMALTVMGASDERRAAASSVPSDPQAAAANAPNSEETGALKKLGTSDALGQTSGTQGGLPPSNIKVNRGISG
ncbi:hypothetical protein [Sulfitobacter sp.]|uniref:hypothetical protein n=1 Tax=Sulfitobacter sp. TaxID=1903071 RepID=UPI003002FCF7